MTHDEIEKLWDSDCNIDPDDLHVESIKIPYLHSKYSKIHNNLSCLKKKAQIEYKQLRLEKWKYYGSKSNPDVYNDKPLDHKILKQDVDKYLEGDEELIKISSKIDYLDMTINFCESILKQINNRTYHIKNAIEWQKFLRGD